MSNILLLHRYLGIYAFGFVNDRLLSFIFVISSAGILFPLIRLVSGPICASLLHSASNRNAIHIHRRITSRVSMTKIPPSISLTWCKWGESLILQVILLFSFWDGDKGTDR